MRLKFLNVTVHVPPSHVETGKHIKNIKTDKKRSFERIFFWLNGYIVFSIEETNPNIICQCIRS